MNNIASRITRIYHQIYQEKLPSREIEWQNTRIGNIVLHFCSPLPEIHFSFFMTRIRETSYVLRFYSSREKKECMPYKLNFI